MEDKELVPIDNESNVDSAFYRAKSKILDYAKNNDFNYMFTLTFSNSKVDISNSEYLKKRILKFFANFKDRVCKSFKYIMVPELGEKNQRLHFHGLAYCDIDKSMFLKYVKYDFKHGYPLYRFEKLFNDCGSNTWIPIKEYNHSCAMYITKYITKDNYLKCTEYKCNYFCSKGLNTSKCLCSYYGDKERNLYEKQVKELYVWLAKKNLIKNYQMCDVAYLNKEQYQDFLKHVYYNPYYKKGFKQLDFSDLISKGGEFCVC